jgi:uncharacterized protein (AIM24 family)
VWIAAAAGRSRLAIATASAGVVATSVFGAPVTSTISGATDTGADPNKLVAVTDQLDASGAGSERFTTLRSAGSREALRGISFTPGTSAQ